MGAPNTRRAARGMAIKPRVLDVLHDMGHGDIDRGIPRFIEHTLWCAEQRGMRVWNDTSKPMKEVATGSLLLLLGRKPSYGLVREGQGMNSNWVLDLWEVACDDWFRVKPAKPGEVEQMDALEAASPAAVATLVGPPDRRLSARILDAYLNRDAEAMLTALGELEEQGL